MDILGGNIEGSVLDSLRIMERNIGNLSAIPEMQGAGFNATINFDDDELFKDFKFLGGLGVTQIEEPSFLLREITMRDLSQRVGTTATEEEFKTIKIESNLDHLNKNLERVNQEIEQLKKMLL